MKKYEGFTPNEFIEDHLNELNEDAIGLWQFVGDKLLFDFTDEELEEYLYIAIKRLIDIGAKPVVMSSGKYLWDIQTKYGNTPEEIANNIIKEWREKQNTENTIDDLNGLWFATENVYSERRE